MKYLYTKQKVENTKGDEKLTKRQFYISVYVLCDTFHYKFNFVYNVALFDTIISLLNVLFQIRPESQSVSNLYWGHKQRT